MYAARMHAIIRPPVKCHLCLLSTSDISRTTSAARSSLFFCALRLVWSRARVRPTVASQDAWPAVSLLIHRILLSWDPLKVPAAGYR